MTGFYKLLPLDWILWCGMAESWKWWTLSSVASLFDPNAPLVLEKVTGVMSALLQKRLGQCLWPPPQSAVANSTEWELRMNPAQNESSKWDILVSRSGDAGIKKNRVKGVCSNSPVVAEFGVACLNLHRQRAPSENFLVAELGRTESRVTELRRCQPADPAPNTGSFRRVSRG